MYDSKVIFQLPILVGDTLLVYAHLHMRKATVLALVGDKALIEFSIKEKTALRVVDKEDPRKYWHCSYARIPFYWIKAMYENSVEWIGNPYQGEEPMRVTEWYHDQQHYRKEIIEAMRERHINYWLERKKVS
jgi:hypothetical protein